MIRVLRSSSTISTSGLSVGVPVISVCIPAPAAEKCSSVQRAPPRQFASSGVTFLNGTRVRPRPKGPPRAESQQEHGGNQDHLELEYHGLPCQPEMKQRR